jgi:galactitol PTS system EIIA component
MFIDKENIFINPKIRSYLELFRLFHKSLFEKGYVKKDFYRSLAEREKSYPTGLDTRPIKIAIPHTDPDMIIKEGLALAVVDTPLAFEKMGSPGSIIQVNIIFLLLIKNNKARFYQNLLNKIRNSDILQRIYKTETRQDLCLLLTELLNT